MSVRLSPIWSTVLPAPPMGEVLLHPANRDDDPLEIRCYFVRERNVLLTRGDFSPLYVDYYLGLADRGQRFSPAHDSFFKELVAAAVLHAASRPWNETAAWTVHEAEPPVNYFVNVDNTRGSVIGTIFEKDIAPRDANFFFADVLAGNAPPRRSVAKFETSNGLRAAEAFFRQSDQRRVRLFTHHDEDFVLLSPQPDADIEWLDALEPDSIESLDRTETLSLLEIRKFRWECGCSQERMEAILRPLMRKDPKALFGDDPSLVMRCPRCGLAYEIARAALEARQTE